MERPLLFRSAADMLYNLLHDKSSAGDKSATSKRAESNWPTLTTLQVHDVSATNLQQIKVGLMDFEPMLARYCYGRVSVCLSVCHKSVFFRNVWVDRASFWRRSFLRRILHCAVGKYQVSTKQGYFSLELCPEI